MKNLREHEALMRNDGFNGNAPLPTMIEDLPHATSIGPNEVTEDRQDTYEALSEGDKDVLYEKIVNQPNSHHAEQKSVGLLLLMT